MNTIRDQAKNPLAVAIGGLIIGILIGLFFGWIVWPVEWTNATPESLSPAWQEEYLRMSIQAFGSSGDAVSAQRQYNALGDAAADTMARVIQSPQMLSPDLISSYATLVTGQAVAPVQPGVTPPTTPGAAPITTPGEAPPGATPGGAGVEPEEEGGMGSLARTLIIMICIVLLLIVGAVAFIFLRGRYPRTGSISAPTPAQMAIKARQETGMTDYTAAGNEPPVAQFMASYKLGDDLFDDSFSIDSPNGEFLGECGVGISEPIGVGEPKKITAFEVWLFDKNDIQTVTKVLMSPHAFQDGAIQQRLEAKGEPVLAEPGAEFVLETQTLQMVARVVDMTFGDGAMPAQSFFDHLLLELAIWQK
jgi:hypothetical protein